MKFTWDQTDYFAAAVVVACFVYVFKHSGAVEFGALCTLVTGFHGLRIYDQKRPDAP
jgi:hypothetical protein